MLVLYRFWPGALDGVVGALDAAPVRSTGDRGVHVSRIERLRGTYALAVKLDGDPPAGAAGGLALAVVAAIADGRAWRRPSGLGWTCGVDLRGHELGDDAGEPVHRPLLVLRTGGGWNVVGVPADRDAWRTLSMTFLNRALYERVDAVSAWLEPEVLEVAALVLSTHRAADVEGTCDLYGIPGALVDDWLDERQEASPRVGEIVQCAAVLHGTDLEAVVRTSGGRLAITTEH